MAIPLSAVPRRLKEIPPPGLVGISYPEQVRLAEAMADQDPRIIPDSLRPMGDEFWNLIDGQRTLADIAEALCMQFGFDLAPMLFVPFAEGLAKADLIALEKTTD